MNDDERLYRRSENRPSISLAGVVFERNNTAIVYYIVKLWSATVGLGEVFASLSLSSTFAFGLLVLLRMSAVDL